MPSASLTKLIALLLVLRGHFSVATKLGKPVSRKITTNAQTLAKRIAYCCMPNDGHLHLANNLMGHFVVHQISAMLTCEDVDGDPDCVLRERVPPLGDARLDDVGAEHLHQHVELQRVREEHGQRHQEQGHLGQSANTFDVEEVAGIDSIKCRLSFGKNIGRVSPVQCLKSSSNKLNLG